MITTDNSATLINTLPELPPTRYFKAFDDVIRQVYTANQMRKYGELCRKAALEESVAEIRGMKANNKTAQSAINQCAEALEELK